MAGGYLRLGISYGLDWAVVVVLAVAGGILNYVTGFHRPFSLADSALTYPDKKDIVSVPILVIVAFAIPAAIIVVVSFVSRSSTLPRDTDHTNHLPRPSSKWSVALWEAHAGVLGLCLALATTLFITSGLKDMVGKPRPNLLARCQPNLDAISKYMVGGLGNSLNSEAEVLVSDGICQQSNRRVLDDAFAAFPSGHSSFSAAGMIYLSLWICMRFCVIIPYLDNGRPSTRQWNTVQTFKGSRMEKAAPPLWQVGIALVPVATALFICSSRYADFHHAGFDIIAGAVLGTAIAWASFRLYHPPMRRSQGLKAWHARNVSNAFFTRSTGQDHANLDEERGHFDRSEANRRQDIGMELDRLQSMQSTPVGRDNSGDPILPIPLSGAAQQNTGSAANIESITSLKR